MRNSRILFIVEGENDEVAFVRQLLGKCYANHEYDIYSYRCNIHVLAQILFDEYPFFEEDEIDIQLVLKSKETRSHFRDLLSQRYQDVFLIFDFEPQDHHPHFDTIIRMLDYFNDSSDHGKLFINYPMMQAYKHFPFLPDDSFATRQVSIEECRYYKQIVGDTSGYTDINDYSYVTFVSLIVHHLRKANLILTGNYSIPSYEDYLTWQGSEIYKLQCSFLEEKHIVFVLNTSVFLGVDFKPKGFFQEISKHESKYDI